MLHNYYCCQEHEKYLIVGFILQMVAAVLIGWKEVPKLHVFKLGS